LKKIIILCGAGMLGHKMFQVLQQRVPDTYCTIRSSLGEEFYKKIVLFQQGEASYRALGIWNQFTASLRLRRATPLSELINDPLARIMAPIYSLLVSGKENYFLGILGKSCYQLS
jgi:hypothetical protein